MHFVSQIYFRLLLLISITILSAIPHTINGKPRNIPMLPLEISVAAINIAPATISAPAKNESFTLIFLRNSFFYNTMIDHAI